MGNRKQPATSNQGRQKVLNTLKWPKDLGSQTVSCVGGFARSFKFMQLFLKGRMVVLPKGVRWLVRIDASTNHQLNSDDLKPSHKVPQP